MEYSKASSNRNVNSRNQTENSGHSSNSLSRNMAIMVKQPISFRDRENFIDEINEDEVEKKVTKRMAIQRHESVELEEPAGGNLEVSAMKDMFSSAGYDAVNRDMQHNSFIYTTDMMVESRPKPAPPHQNISRFNSQQSSGRRRVSIESDYDLGRSRGEFPPTLKMSGLIFFRVELQ